VFTRPSVVAHRGASAVEAEHTLAAYVRALDDGADGLECDVRLTRDGVLVCVHDRTVNRTSSGRGVVSTLELADLSELDFGSWRTPADDDLDPLLSAHWEAPDLDRTAVLTLDRLLQMVTEVDRPMRLAIETKHPTRYAGLVESTLVETLGRYDLARGEGSGSKHLVQVMSFAPTGLRRIRTLAPDLPTVHLMKRLPLHHRDGSVSTSATIAGPSLEAVKAFPSYVERAHARGHEVHVWTVDEPEDVDAMVSLGVDVLITNRPAEVRAQLDALISS
jgi:glycerophosphoryl diester phosphodiesterase